MTNCGMERREEEEEEEEEEAEGRTSKCEMKDATQQAQSGGKKGTQTVRTQWGTCF